MMITSSTKESPSKSKQMATTSNRQQQHHHHRHHHRQHRFGSLSSLTKAITTSTIGKSSNSSNETVIAAAAADGGGGRDHQNAPSDADPNRAIDHFKGTTSETNNRSKIEHLPLSLADNDANSERLSAACKSQFQGQNDDQQTKATANNTTNYKSNKIKYLIHLAGYHLNPFGASSNHISSNSSGSSSGSSNARPQKRSKHHGNSIYDLLDPDHNQSHMNRTKSRLATNDHHHQAKSNFINSIAYRYFNIRIGNNHNHHAHQQSRSAPVTPIKFAQEAPGTTPVRANGYTQTEPSMFEQMTPTNANNKLVPPQQEVAAANHQQAHRSKHINNNNNNNEGRQTAGVGHPPQRPSVRFVETTQQQDSATVGDATLSRRDRKKPICASSRILHQAERKPNSNETFKYADCAVQTGQIDTEEANGKEDEEDNDKYNEDDDDDDDDDDQEQEQLADQEGLKLVARLFKIPSIGQGDLANNETNGECPMNSERFRDYGYKLIDYISNYLDTIGKRRVTPLNIEPGYLKSLIQADAPEQGESFATIMHDFENHIMCGITHWQHPHFHAYFPAGNAYPSILADMLSDALGCVGFSWAASPAYTELEIIMLDWMGKMIGLPDEFLCLSGAEKADGSESSSKGGGVIQGSASECVLVNLLAARHWAMDKLRKKYPQTPDGILLSKLIGYCSKEAHSCVEKAAMIGFIRMRALETDDKHALRGETLAQAIAADKAQGLEPFIVCATLGTTSCVSFDNLEELGQVCRNNDDLWLHVDAAYAGSALICPEFKYLMRGIEMATSFNMNPNKWMLINFDCSLMWVKDRFKLTRAFVVDPLYLQHSFSDQAIDYRHWGIPLSRRFRALKLWFVIRNYGVEGLRNYIRNHVKLAKLFEKLIREDKRFTIINEVVLGLVCFRLIGSNALNQRLLSMINASGKLHMVPASLNGRYVIRFCVCDQNAKEKDIYYAYRCISEFATELFESIKSGKERIRAISQQNTIDVSSISLHTQQSASADRLNSSANSGLISENANNSNSGQGSASKQQQQQASACSAASVARQHFMRRNSRHGHTFAHDSTTTSSTTNELQQAALEHQLGPTNRVVGGQAQVQQQHQQQPVKRISTVQRPDSAPGAGADVDDLEQEIAIDSLATIDGCDYDLEDVDNDDDDALLEAGLFEEPPVGGGGTASAGHRHTEPGASGAPSDETAAAATAAAGAPLAAVSPQQAGASERSHGRLSRASRASRTFAAGSEQEEAADEVFTLAEKRNRMSLRYKREFFVRVVSDPRVYRASISGDINAHASTSSLGGATQLANQTSGSNAPQPNNDDSQQQQQQQQQLQLQQTVNEK